jgi:hypothetical protein
LPKGTLTECFFRPGMLYSVDSTELVASTENISRERLGSRRGLSLKERESCLARRGRKKRHEVEEVERQVPAWVGR